MATNKQRVDASDAFGSTKKQNVLEKMMPPSATTEEQQPVPQAQVETPHVEEQEETDQVQKGGRQLKQVAFAIGMERAEKLDDLAYDYNKKKGKGTRIGRNDIARYLFDKVTLEDLLKVDLKDYKK